jgi:hypothetical protein
MNRVRREGDEERKISLSDVGLATPTIGQISLNFVGQILYWCIGRGKVHIYYGSQDRVEGYNAH